MKKTAILSVVVLFLNLFCVSSALGESGYIAGTIKHFNRIGNYCPSSSNCTGAKYTQSEYNTALPVKNAKVTLNVVFNQGSGETVIPIGTGSTNSNGYYKFYWYINPSDWTNYTTNGVFQLRWNPAHKDNRFTIKSSSGGTWFFWGSVSSLTSGTTYNSPQSLGTKQWGSSNSPNALTNLYEGAERMWENLSTSSRMNTYFTGIDIIAWDDSECSTSCAYGDDKRIVIDSEGSAYKPQGRVMHEMGHIASHLASRDQSVKTCANLRSSYNYATQTNFGWELDSQENGCIQFEEGLATFFADTAFYSQDAVSPATCISDGICNLMLEPSSGAVGTCASGEDRWALTVDRFLWDLYDNNIDFTSETFSYTLDDLINVIYEFPNGTDDYQKNEPWNSTLTSVVDLDGRSGTDYLYHFIYDFLGSPGIPVLVNLLTTYTSNCSPVGD